MNEYFDGSVGRVAKGSLIKSQHINDARDAISVAFDNRPSQVSLLTNTGTLCAETGLANAYAIAMPSVAATTYVTGLQVSFIAGNVNTGPSTLNLDSLGPKGIKRNDGSDLVAGDIRDDHVTSLRFDGTNFIMTASYPPSSYLEAIQSSADAVAAGVAAGVAETAAGVAETAAGVAESTASTKEGEALTSAGNAGTSETNSSADLVTLIADYASLVGTYNSAESDKDSTPVTLTASINNAGDAATAEAAADASRVAAEASEAAALASEVAAAASLVNVQTDTAAIYDPIKRTTGQIAIRNLDPIDTPTNLQVEVLAVNENTGELLLGTSSAPYMSFDDGVSVAAGVWTANPSTHDDVIWVEELSLWVCVGLHSGATNAVQTSPDGLVWTSRLSDGHQWPTSIVWSPELTLLVAVGADGVITSSNGIDWTNHGFTAPMSNAISVAYSPELELFVLTRNDATTPFATSSNGTTWTGQTGVGSAIYNDICWSPELGLFVAGESSGGVSTEIFATSPDGINWTARSAPADVDVSSIAWSPDHHMFLASTNASSLNKFLISHDGINWEFKQSHTGAVADKIWGEVVYSKKTKRFIMGASGGLVATDRLSRTL